MSPESEVGREFQSLEIPDGQANVFVWLVSNLTPGGC